MDLTGSGSSLAGSGLPPAGLGSPLARSGLPLAGSGSSLAGSGMTPDPSGVPGGLHGMLLGDGADTVSKEKEGEDPGTEKLPDPEPSSGLASPYGDYQIPLMVPWRIKAMKASKQRAEPVATERGPQMVPKAAPKSYATGVSQNLPHQLSVHLGTEERTFVDEATFTTLMDEMEKRMLAADTKEVLPIWCAYTRWASG